MATVPSVSNSITVRMEVPARGNAVSQVTTLVESCGGTVTGLDVTASGLEALRIDVTIAAASVAHAEEIVDKLRTIDGISIGKVSDRTFLMHLGGKIEMSSKVPIRNRDDLSMIYTPGVARVCMAIAENPDDARRLTIKRNSVAVVTDGSAVLGLGNIGPKAALPVMEGKAALFKRFAGIDAWPLCLDTQDSDEIVAIVKAIAPGFAGINLEDISAPRCFEIEARLREALDIPVFHDDQHGTAIVVLAALTNALQVVGKEIGDVRVVMSGAGAAGTAILKLLLDAGVQHATVADVHGVVHGGPARTSTTRCAGSPTTPTAAGAPAASRRPSAAPTSSSASPRPTYWTATTSRPWPTTPSCSRWPTRTPRSIRRWPGRPPRWSPPDAATSPTRSTTCWSSRVSSAACWTPRAAPSTAR